MNAKRLTAALVIALLISGLFTFWLSRHVTKTAHASAPQKLLYVAAVKALNAGEALKPESLRLVEWPSSAPLAGAFIKTADVAGRTVLYPLAAGEPILDRHLAAAGAGVGLSANIPPGMRAIAVRSDEVVGVAGFMQPGTRVDVLLTYHSENSPEPKTSTVLQDVVILAAGQQIHPDPDGKPASFNVVTLLLKPQDAERVVLATSLGAIHFVLRNGADREQTSNPTIGLNELTGPPTPSLQTVRSVNTLPQLKSKGYEVVTFLGDKQIVNSFNEGAHVNIHD